MEIGPFYFGEFGPEKNCLCPNLAFFGNPVFFCLQGGTDTMFFIENDNIDSLRPHLAMISLNRSDRLRLINFEPEMTPIVEEVITTFYQENTPKMRDYHGSTEFNLDGSPFCCSGVLLLYPSKLYSEVVHFSNMFTNSFYVQKSQKSKKTVKLSIFFALLGQLCLKAAKVSILLTFLYDKCFAKLFSKYRLALYFFVKRILAQNPFHISRKR